jgi:hypothetical protein
VAHDAFHDLQAVEGMTIAILCADARRRFGSNSLTARYNTAPTAQIAMFERLRTQASIIGGHHEKEPRASLRASGSYTGCLRLWALLIRAAGGVGGWGAAAPAALHVKSCTP